MNETYITYLEMKVKELKAQNKLLVDSLYHRESRIRTITAALRMFDDQTAY